jgi:hypothetical protein
MKPATLLPVDEKHPLMHGVPPGPTWLCSVCRTRIRTGQIHISDKPHGHAIIPTVPLPREALEPKSEPRRDSWLVRVCLYCGDIRGVVASGSIGPCDEITSTLHHDCEDPYITAMGDAEKVAELRSYFTGLQAIHTELAGHVVTILYRENGYGVWWVERVSLWRESRQRSILRCYCSRYMSPLFRAIENLIERDIALRKARSK